MDLGIKDKKALIAAAGRGIGKAVALDLAKEGVKVCVVSRTESDLKKVVEAMGGPEKGHHYVVADLTQEGAPKDVINHVQKDFGDPDILVNNTGDLLGVMDPLCSIEDWRKVLRINLEVTIELTNLCIGPMLKNKWGRIVNTASTASLENNGPITYCAAKAALLAYTRGLGRIYAKEGVVISSVLPGAVIDEGSSWDIKMKERPEHAEKYLKERCPLERFGKPEEISAMIALLCSERATFCQGAIVPVDGGQSRHFFNASYSS